MSAEPKPWRVTIQLRLSSPFSRTLVYQRDVEAVDERQALAQVAVGVGVERGVSIDIMNDDYVVEAVSVEPCSTT